MLHCVRELVVVLIEPVEVLSGGSGGGVARGRGAGGGGAGEQGEEEEDYEALSRSHIVSSYGGMNLFR